MKLRILVVAALVMLTVAVSGGSAFAAGPPLPGPQLPVPACVAIFDHVDTPVVHEIKVPPITCSS